MKNVKKAVIHISQHSKNYVFICESEDEAKFVASKIKDEVDSAHVYKIYLEDEEGYNEVLNYTKIDYLNDERFFINVYLPS
jgi:Rad3-related DNA helicase